MVKEKTEKCGCCGGLFVTLARHYRFVPGYGSGGVSAGPVNKPSRCASWAISQGLNASDFSKTAKVPQIDPEHKEEIDIALEILRLYAPHLLVEDKQRKKIVRLHEYEPNWDMLKPGTPIRHREENKTSGKVDEWAGVYRSPKEMVRLSGGTEVVFKSLNAFREAHLGWCIENGKTNKTTKTGNAYEEMEFCGPDGEWRFFNVIRHEVQRANEAAI
jgi:hypothetical protein